MEAIEMFNLLETTDSTNNYAMAMVHAGLAKHGMAWFAREQTMGKGQHGKTWESRAGQNIIISMGFQPGRAFFQKQFLFNATVTMACFDFFKGLAGPESSVKWPNDIYWRDRKAGGILIENKLMGNNWNWSVVGIGLNINQESFSKKLVNPVSLSQICGRKFDPIALAKELHRSVCLAIDTTHAKDFKSILHRYNEHLYLRGKTARLRKGNITFETTIIRVNEFGQLITQDAVERVFNFGEVELLI